MGTITSNEDSGAAPPLPVPIQNVPAYIRPECEGPAKCSIMSRCGVGSSGQRISLLTNHFKALINAPDTIFYQYTVSFNSEDKRDIEGKVIGRKLIDKLYQTYSCELSGRKYAYDGDRNLYTVGPLPQTEFEFSVELEGTSARRANGEESPCDARKRTKHLSQSKTFKVQLCFASKIPLKSISLALKGVDADSNAQDALRVLDIILRQQASKSGCLLVRQSFFHDDSRNFIDVGGGVSGVKGFYSSFRPTQDGLSLNMDVSTTMVLTPGPVIEFLVANQNVKEFRDIDWSKARRMLKNMRVKARHRNVEFKIIGLSEKPCNQQFFSMKLKNCVGKHGEEGKTTEVTVYEYFVNHCGIELTYSEYLPCLDVGKPKRPSYLPLELCSLLSLQRYTKALSPVQRASLVAKIRQKPLERIQIVADAVENYHYDENPVLAECGISIEKQLTQVYGRVLETPKLKVGDNNDCIPQRGRWNFNNKTLLKPMKIDRWVIVNFSARCDTSRLSRELIDCGRRKGMQIECPIALMEEDPHSRKESPVGRVEILFERIREKLARAPTFILCILPERKNSSIYGPWKKKCLCEFGIVTQCISPIKITDQYLTNVLIKINAKLGGINSLLTSEHFSSVPIIKDTPTMILGMDVSHGSPGQSDVPSIAAVAGSRYWPLISRYRAAVRTQSPKAEMINALYKPLADGDDDGIMRELFLDFYQTSNGRKPNQIIVFRDGVSESQFNQVLNIELEQIIKAYQDLGETTVPKFTVIIAQKNHHTKLFQANAPENVPPGTVVDTNIVHPRNFDFYMCTHAGMMGTTRPAHYHVLIDEIGFSADDLQNFIHALSYVYQRSTSAVSIVAPICYAHLAAQQLGQFINFEDLSEASPDHASITSPGSIPVLELPRLHEDVESSMFFC